MPIELRVQASLLLTAQEQFDPLPVDSEKPHNLDNLMGNKIKETLGPKMITLGDKMVRTTFLSAILSVLGSSWESAAAFLQCEKGQCNGPLPSFPGNKIQRFPDFTSPGTCATTSLDSLFAAGAYFSQISTTVFRNRTECF